MQVHLAAAGARVLAAGPATAAPATAPRQRRPRSAANLADPAERVVLALDAPTCNAAISQ